MASYVWRFSLQGPEALRRTTGVRHSRQTSGFQCRDDVSICSPASRAATGSIAEGNRRSTLDGDLLQLAAAEEPQPLTVRREERKRRYLGAGEPGDFRLVRPPHGDLVPGDERQALTLG